MQADLHLCFSHMAKTGFLMMWLILALHVTQCIHMSMNARNMKFISWFKWKTPVYTNYAGTVYISFAGLSLGGYLGEIVSLNCFTSPCFVLREKFKCIELIRKCILMAKTSPWIQQNFSLSKNSRLSSEFSSQSHLKSRLSSEFSSQSHLKYKHGRQFS